MVTVQHGVAASPDHATVCPRQSVRAWHTASMASPHRVGLPLTTAIDCMALNMSSPSRAPMFAAMITSPGAPWNAFGMSGDFASAVAIFQASSVVCGVSAADQPGAEVVMVFVMWSLSWTVG